MSESLLERAAVMIAQHRTPGGTDGLSPDDVADVMELLAARIAELEAKVAEYERASQQYAGN
jgi:hypothetical protein